MKCPFARTAHAAALFVILLCGAMTSHAATITIPTDQPTIQAGIDVAAHGDTVALEPGTYFENFVVGDKLLTLMSTAGRDSTFIEPAIADSSILTVISSEHTLYLRGLTFRNGDAPYGGAIRSFDRPLNLRECSIVECVAESGGGLYMNGGDLEISGSSFTDNTACESGTVIYSGTSDTRFDSCEFLRNVNTTSSCFHGGTIHISNGTVILEGCLFENNEGCHNTLACFGDSVYVDDCIIRGGRTEECWCGGGASGDPINGSVYSQERLYMSNCLVEDIEGIALAVNYIADIRNCTFAGCENVLVVEILIAQISNSIIHQNNQVLDVKFYTGIEGLSVNITDIFGNSAGDWEGVLSEVADSNGNFSADPRFCDPENGDYHIDAYSPCAPEYSPNGQLVGALGVGCQSDYICGDPNISGGIDIDDIVYLIDYVFLGGMSPIPEVSGDANCSGAIDVDDLVYLIAYVFQGGAAPCDPDGDGVPDC